MPKRKQRANAKGKASKGKVTEAKKAKPTAIKDKGKGYATKKKLALTAKTENQKLLFKSK